jgi:hypothetical protein
VYSGQVAIQHQDVVLVHPETFKCRISVIGDIHRHRLAPQPDRDGVGQQPFVLHDQYPHDVSPTPWLGLSRWPAGHPAAVSLH